MQAALDKNTHDLILVPQDYEENLVSHSEALTDASWNNLAVDEFPNDALAPDGIKSADRFDSQWTEQNLLTYSEQFDHGNWQKIDGILVDPNDIVAPDGTLTADKVYEDSLDKVHRIKQGVNIDNIGQPYTFAVYLKAAEVTTGSILLWNGTDQSTVGIVYDLTAGTVFANQGVAGIDALDNGWFRIWGTGTPTVASNQVMVYLGTGAYLGNGSDGLYMWGAQLAQKDSEPTYEKTEATNIPTSSGQTIIGNKSNFLESEYLTVSTYIKKGTGRYVCQTIWNNDDVLRQYFDLDNIALSKTTLGSGTFAITLHDAGIESVGDGWLRIWTTSYNPNLLMLSLRLAQMASDTIHPFEDQTDMSHWVWGGQVEEAQSVGVYHKTGADPFPYQPVSGGGGIARVTDGRYTVQLVKSRLLTALGEWALDPRIGWLSINDYEKNPDLFDIELRARQIILSTPDVKAIEEMNLELKNRVLYLTFQATTTFGIIDLTVPWGNQ